jgi:hypothetical protein
VEVPLEGWVLTKILEKVFRATCVMRSKFGMGRVVCSRYAGLHQGWYVSIGHYAAYGCFGYHVLVLGISKEGRSRMSEVVGFSQPYGAILAKIRHLQHDNER